MPRTNERIAAVDAGASLAKVALAGEPTGVRLESGSSLDLEAVARRVEALSPERVALTGCGASWLAARLALPTGIFDEFAAWGAGARHLLARGVADAPERFLMVSLGTGTSVVLVEPASVRRVGGTALGGGTLLGLGRALLGVSTFGEIAALAARGDRHEVDLVLSDIYAPGAIALPDWATVASFGRLARDGAHAVSREDLAAGVVHLVSENVGLLCGGLAQALGVRDVAVGGSTVPGNAALVETLTRLVGAFGCATHVLEDAAYAGALGAIELLRARA
ncbi:MAG: hypothetical protein KC560_06460 [Myxococcales bacterium]|nr:hypothetical protein [Myxococcales bacterium]